MLNEVLLPGLRPLGDTVPATAAKISWNQANGYFLTTGASAATFTSSSFPKKQLNSLALLCFKWAQNGVDLRSGLERYVLGTLLVTQVTTGTMYFRKGVNSVGATYYVLSLLMSIAAYRQGK